MATRGWRAPEVHPQVRRLISSGEVLVANCEGPVRSNPRVSRIGRERPSVEFVAATLEQLGADPHQCVLSVANNHCLDHGPDDVAVTVEKLQALGVRPVGHRTAESSGDDGVVRIDLDGLHLVIAAWTDWLNHSPRRPPVWTEPPPPELWSQASSATLPLLFPHWGWELELAPRDAVRTTARRLLDHRAAVLVGHHPHVVQPAERLGDSLCLYSAGNLLGPPIPLRWTMRLGLIVELWVSDRGLAGFALHPIVQLPGPTLAPLSEAPRRLRRRLNGLLTWMKTEAGSAPSPSPTARAAAHREAP